MDVDSNCHTIYVYTDVVESTVVRDSLVPLLRIVDTGFPSDTLIHRVYDRPRFLPVQKKNFDSLEISKNTNTGQLAPFDSGTVVIVLHFRERKSPYFVQ